MKNLYSATAILCMAIGLHFMWSPQAHTKSTGSPLESSGSPGDNNATCAKGGCHVGTVNPGSGTRSISSDMVGNEYRTGEVYNINVQVDDGRNNYGFLITAEDNAGNKVGEFIGSSDVTSEDFLGHTGAYATHKITKGTGDWNFQWQAPATDVGDITFYAAFNAANGNGNTSGDRIYTATYTTTYSILSGVEERNSVSGLQLYPSPAVDYFDIAVDGNTSGAATLKMLSLDGKVLRQELVQVRSGVPSRIDVAGLSSGMYLVQLTMEDGNLYSSRLIKQ